MKHRDTREPLLFIPASITLLLPIDSVAVESGPALQQRLRRETPLHSCPSSPVGGRSCTQVRERGQSIAKHVQNQRAIEAWARQHGARAIQTQTDREAGKSTPRRPSPSQPQNSTTANSALLTSHSGQRQSSGISAKRVPAVIPSSGRPSSSL